MQLPGDGSDHSCWRSRCDAQRQSQRHTRSQHTLQRARNPDFRRGCRAARCRGSRTETTRHPRAHLARERAATLHGTSWGHLEATLQVPACTRGCHNRSRAELFRVEPGSSRWATAYQRDAGGGPGLRSWSTVRSTGRRATTAVPPVTAKTCPTATSVTLCADYSSQVSRSLLRGKVRLAKLFYPDAGRTPLRSTCSFHQACEKR